MKAQLTAARWALQKMGGGGTQLNILFVQYMTSTCIQSYTEYDYNTTLYKLLENSQLIFLVLV